MNSTSVAQAGEAAQKAASQAASTALDLVNQALGKVRDAALNDTAWRHLRGHAKARGAVACERCVDALREQRHAL